VGGHIVLAEPDPFANAFDQRPPHSLSIASKPGLDKPHNKIGSQSANQGQSRSGPEFQQPRPRKNSLKRAPARKAPLTRMGPKHHHTCVLAVQH
jgi:hypothetical protein